MKGNPPYVNQFNGISPIPPEEVKIFYDNSEIKGPNTYNIHFPFLMDNILKQIMRQEILIDIQNLSSVPIVFKKGDIIKSNISDMIIYVSSDSYEFFDIYAYFPLIIKSNERKQVRVIIDPKTNRKNAVQEAIENIIKNNFKFKIETVSNVAGKIILFLIPTISVIEFPYLRAEPIVIIQSNNLSVSRKSTVCNIGRRTALLRISQEDIESFYLRYKGKFSIDFGNRVNADIILKDNECLDFTIYFNSAEKGEFPAFFQISEKNSNFVAVIIITGKRY
ncbi:MAG: hypothetical protein QXM07_09640 [Nitrososphaerota archaeon]